MARAAAFSPWLAGCVQLPPEVVTKSGEEDEDVIFKM